MKNIHVLPTDKPSRLRYNLSNVLVLTKEPYRDYSKQANQNIYITNDEEIKEGGYVFWEGKIYKYRDFMKMRTPVYTDYFSIILTTDTDLIKDGVQAIDDEFLEWFVKNPSCEEVDMIYEPKNYFDIKQGWEYLIIIPKEEQKQHLINMMKADEELGLYEEPKQETLEEAVKNYCIKKYSVWVSNSDKSDDFINGAKWQQERIYNEKKLYSEIEWLIISWNNDGTKTAGHLTRQIIEQLKKK
jgi:hypothetical protein